MRAPANYTEHAFVVPSDGKGKTYAQFPATGLTPEQTATKAALIQGETLRGLLLNAYGWSQVGTYAFYAAIGLAVAAFAMLLAFLFELVSWRRAARARGAVAPVSTTPFTTKAA